MLTGQPVIIDVQQVVFGATCNHLVFDHIEDLFTSVISNNETRHGRVL